jgi:cytochrome b561
MTPTSYDRGAQLFHWVSALLILGMAIGGTVMVRLPESATVKATMYQGHVAVGLLVLLLTVGRIIWLFVGKRPSPPPMPQWEKLAFVWNHRLLYLIIVALLISGVSTLLLSEIGLSPAAVSPEAIMDVPPRAGHSLSGKLFMVLFVMHLGGVGFYQLKRGDTLGRMGITWFSGKGVTGSQ